jgi:1,4-dihydroxy-2-naphthoate octaprenyltransferase
MTIYISILAVICFAIAAIFLDEEPPYADIALGVIIVTVVFGFLFVDPMIQSLTGS